MLDVLSELRAAGSDASGIVVAIGPDAAGVLVGFAFLTKYLQAFLVLPALVVGDTPNDIECALVAGREATFDVAPRRCPVAHRAGGRAARR